MDKRIIISLAILLLSCTKNNYHVKTSVQKQNQIEAYILRESWRNQTLKKAIYLQIKKSKKWQKTFSILFN